MNLEIIRDEELMMIELIDVGDKRLEVMRCGSGKPFVVILPGMACHSYGWLPVMEAVSAHTSVVAVHRAGCGQSDIGQSPHHVANTVSDLSRLFDLVIPNEAAILVGHSYGGLCAQAFVKQNPHRVAGLVLVDSTSVNLHRLNELQLPTMDAQDSDAAWIESCERYAAMSVVEILRDPLLEMSEHDCSLPADVQSLVKAFYSSPRLYGVMAEEAAHWLDCAKAIRSHGQFPKIPVTVIARDFDLAVKKLMASGIPESEAVTFESTWRDLVAEQAGLSEHGRLIVADRAGHCIHEDRPDFVTGAILETVSRSNHHHD